MVLPGTGSHSPVRQSFTTPCTVAMASGVSCHSGLATRSRRVPRWSTASSENFFAIAFQASQSVLDCQGGEIAGLNECTNGCMSVVLMSCFSYQVAAGSTTSENSVEQVLEEVLVALGARAEQVGPPQAEDARVVLLGLGVLDGEVQCAGLELVDHVVGRGHVGVLGLVDEVEAAAV